MENIVIRKATISDLDLVQKLTQEMLVSDTENDPDLISSWALGDEAKDYLIGLLARKEGACFIAEIQDKPVGFVIGEYKTIQKFRPVKRSELESILVDKNYRGKGIGEKLLEEFTKWSKSMGMERIVLSVVHDNSNAVNFYEKRQFKSIRLILEKDI
jgi:ribosomal protein S18 acetylase RimI-like enzyme